MSWTQPRSMAGFQVITYGRFWVFTEDELPVAAERFNDLVVALESQLRIRPHRPQLDAP